MTITKETVQQWAADFDAKTPQEILALALDNFGENAAISFSGADDALVEEMVSKKGMFSFYTEDHKECCGVRKVAPLRKKLATLDAWITGQRKDQSPGTRVSVPVVQPDAPRAR